MQARQRIRTAPFWIFEYDQLYGQGNGPPRNSLKTGAQVPVEILAEVDRKIDDGLPYVGAVQFSTYAPAGGTQPTSGGAQGCIGYGC